MAAEALSTPSASAGPQAEALASKIENWSPESRHPLTLIARERRQIAAALRAQPQQATPQAEAAPVAWRWHYKLEADRWFYQPFKPDLSKLSEKWEVALEPLYAQADGPAK